jgi:queuosine precursor transporter
MINELLFIAHVASVSIGALLFARAGKTALITYIALLFVMANIFVIKQIELFNFCVTSADAFIVGISFSCNMLQEFWSKQYARKAIWISFAASIAYMIITKIIMLYTPATCDETQLHFMLITQNTMRITMASCIAYLITQFLDIKLYEIGKKITHGKYFVARNYFALTVSQLTDTVLFSFLGLYGIVANISDILLLSFAVKMIAIVLTTPFLIIAKRMIRYDRCKT